MALLSFFLIWCAVHSTSLGALVAHLYGLTMRLDIITAVFSDANKILEMKCTGPIWDTVNSALFLSSLIFKGKVRMIFCHTFDFCLKLIWLCSLPCHWRWTWRVFVWSRTQVVPVVIELGQLAGYSFCKTGRYISVIRHKDGPRLQASASSASELFWHESEMLATGSFVSFEWNFMWLQIGNDVMPLFFRNNNLVWGKTRL